LVLGVAIDVPLSEPYCVSEPDIVDISELAVATTSGLIRPSSVGPKFEKPSKTTCGLVTVERRLRLIRDRWRLDWESGRRSDR
jgi:hypothetical protein